MWILVTRMQMYIRKIKEVYPILYEHIISQLRPHTSEERIQHLDVNSSLSWADTKEGSHFWSLIYNEKWEEAKSFLPEYFSPKHIKKGDILIKSNGLFR